MINTETARKRLTAVEHYAETIFLCSRCGRDSRPAGGIGKPKIIGFGHISVINYE